MDSLVLLEIKVIKVLLVPQGHQVNLVILEHLGNLEILELLDHLEIAVRMGNLEVLELQVTGISMFVRLVQSYTETDI